MIISDDDSIHIALLSDPDAAVDFLELLAEGTRLALAARKVGKTESAIKDWRAASQAFDRMCIDAEAAGTASIEDIGLTHVRAGTPGWSAAWKTILQQRDETYSDKSKSEKKETVNVIVNKRFDEDE